METLGSPERDDPTARLEKLANGALERIERIAENVVPNIVNRPFDSQAVPRDQLLAEYRAAVVPLGVQGYGQKLEQFIQQEGESRGLQMFLDYTEDMEKG